MSNEPNTAATRVDGIRFAAATAGLRLIPGILATHELPNFAEKLIKP